MPSKITLSEFNDMLDDVENVSDAEIAAYLKETTGEGSSWQPAVAVDMELVDDEGLEADVAVAFLNRADRRRRQWRYKRRIKEGYDGLRIVSEGDSWFQYPFILKDTIDWLSEAYAVYSLGAAGDLVSDMVQQDEMVRAIREIEPHVLLLSGGGNDLLGEGRLKLAVKEYRAGRKAENYPNAKFDKSIRQVIGDYRKILTDVTTAFPDLRIICHGYDYALPDKGRWLGKPLAAKKITDPALQAEIIAVMIDRFNLALNDLIEEFPGQVYRVDCRGAVDEGQWHDELHPDKAGYASVANRFYALIESVTGSAEIHRPKTARLSPGIEARVDTAKDLDAKSFRELVDHRARELLSERIMPTDSEEDRRAIEQEIEQYFEKISGGADFLPASFLREGARCADAVCRISTSRSYGSGFLVATRNFIMTNNHVIGTREEAEETVAEFGFEHGESKLKVALQPRRFFVTDAHLDFTIVACDGAELGDITPIPLLRNPSTVTRYERVNIIQHPRGRPKEVALHDNEVMRVKDVVVHYSTDTEPGSSGSPVFNNSWDLVALHHAGWHQGDVTTNEGIRIAAIVAHLIGEQTRESTGSPMLRELLGTIPDSSPHLGFFDVVGITGANAQEVELPEFRGAADFADIGFWNIEHFNASAPPERIEKVAGVLAHLSLDAIGLCEIQRSAMEDLVDALQGMGHAYAFKYFDVVGGQDLAMLYDSRTTEVTISQGILNRHRDAWAATTVTGRTAFPRRPMIARVKVAPRASDGGTVPDNRAVEFIMISVHLKAFGDPESRARRKLAAEILREVIADIRETENLPVVLGGDLNETLNTDVLSPLTDAPDLLTLTSDDADDNALSYIGSRYRSLIDHIIVSDDVVISPISGDDAAIIRLDRSVRDFSDDVSDHVPLVMRIVSRDAPVQVDDAGDSGGFLSGSIPSGASSIKVTFD